MNAYKWILSYMKKYQWKFFFGLFLTLFVTGLSLVPSYLGGVIVDKVFQQGNYSLLAPFIAISIGATIVKSVIKYGYTMLFESISQSIVLNMRHNIYKRIQEQSFFFFDNNRTGDIMARITGDLDAIRHFMAFVVYNLTENIMIFIVAISITFLINWQIALLMVATSAITFYLIRKSSKLVKPAFWNIREQFSRLNSVCQENISGNRVVKAFTKEDFELQKFTIENQKYYDTNLAVAKVFRKYMPVVEFLATLLNVILLLVGGLMVIYGHMELWELVIVNGLLWALVFPMRMIGWLLNDVQRFSASLDKVYDMMSTGIGVQNPENPLHVERIKGRIEFKNVSFSYDKGEEKNMVLKNISFKAEPGETIGIIGATGAGKTTLVNLIGRYYDALEGEVLVDGVNVKKYDLKDLRKDIAFASQDIFLFSDTVEGNVVYGKPDAPMDVVTEAAEAANASEFIANLPEGYDTIIGERGVGLSGGQKQRLALSRAIAVAPSILILDDTTSAVDMETEHEIQTTLKTKYANCTKFVIAHRISSLKDADLILVMDDGRIVERGTHAQLLDAGGDYSGIFASQYGGVING